MNLHKEFVKLSFDIIKMKNKLISLLLKIYEKEIYKDHGCRTIYEYGFKYAKLSKEMVDKAVRTLKNLENKPTLKKIVETQGIHKVALVATIATPENEKIFAKHVENMSKPALFEFAKELRQKQGMKQFCQAVPSKMQIELDEEMQTIFLRLKRNLNKKSRHEISNKEALKIILKNFEEMAGEKAKNDVTKVPRNSVPGNGIEIPSRHILIQKKREILQKYHNKCAYPGCTKPIEEIHHRIPFAFKRSHESVIPLCKIHHEFAHNGLIAHELKEPKNWKLQTEGQKSVFDQFYLMKRKFD